MELSRGRFAEGRILRRTEVDVPPQATLNQLTNLLGWQGSLDVMDVVAQLDTALAQAQPQSALPEQPSRAPKLRRVGDLDLAALTAEQVQMEGGRWLKRWRFNPPARLIC